MYRILSLYGGGIRALLQAHYLRLVSRDPDVGEFWRKFDLIIGTSAGSIVAAALAVGHSPEAIAKIFETKGKAIFSAPLLWKTRAALGQVKIGKSLTRRPLKRQLEEIYGKRKLGDFKQPALAITATEIERREVRVFSTLTTNTDAELSLIDVVMASAALPGAFGHYSIVDPEDRVTRHYIDGGLWANSPMLAAVVLAAENLIPLADIRVVSLGTAAPPPPLKLAEYNRVAVAKRGFFRHLFDIASYAAEDTSKEAVRRLIGKDNVLHVDGPTEKQIAAWEVDKALRELPRVAEDLASNRSYLDKLKELVA